MKKPLVLALFASLVAPVALVATDATAAPPNQAEVEKAAKDALLNARFIHGDAITLYKNSTSTHQNANQEWSLAHWMAWRADRVAFDQLRILGDDRRLGTHGKCMLAHSDYATAVMWEQRANNLNQAAADLDKQSAELASAAADARNSGAKELGADLDKRAADRKASAAADRTASGDASTKAANWLKAAQGKAQEANAAEANSCAL
jgi:hypothetical protein